MKIDKASFDAIVRLLLYDVKVKVDDDNVKVKVDDDNVKVKVDDDNVKVKVDDDNVKVKVEVEARYVAADGSDISRDTVQRLLSVLQHEATPSVTDALDVQVPDGAGGTYRVSVAGTEAVRAWLAPSSNAATAAGGDGGRLDFRKAPKTAEAMRKSRVPGYPPVDLPNFRMRVNMKLEETVPLSMVTASATNGRMTLRMKRRFSFAVSPALRVDVTAVRSMAGVDPARTPGQNLYSSLTSAPEKYEIEVEVLDGGDKKADKKVDNREAWSRSVALELLKRFSMILKVIDDAPVVLTPEEKEAATREYLKLSLNASGPTLPKNPRALARMFVGPKPVTLEMQHLMTPEELSELQTGLHTTTTVLNDYTVTPKADGERRLLFVAADSRVYEFNDRLDVRGTGLLAPGCESSLIDGEHVEPNDVFENGAYLAFDALFLRGKDVRSLPLTSRVIRGPEEEDDEDDEEDKKKNKKNKKTKKKKTKTAGGATDVDVDSDVDVDDRLGAATAVVEAISSSSSSPGQDDLMRVLVKEFRSIVSGDDAFRESRHLLRKRDAGSFDYEVDGLVYTPAKEPMPARGGRWDKTLKWKPPEDNSIDFTVRMRPDDEVHVSKSKVYRVCELNVAVPPGRYSPITALAFLTGAAEKAQRDRAKGAKHGSGEPEERPFAVPGYPDVHVCNIPRGDDGRVRCQNGDEILDGYVVEFSFDGVPKPGETTSMSWVPKRVRWDKVSLQAATGVVAANAMNTALSIWRTIVDPVSEDVITGREKPALSSTASNSSESILSSVYYATGLKAEQGEAAPLRKFHNYVKRKLMLSFKPVARSLFDIGCGRAGDLHRWVEMSLSRVMGIDRFASNLENPDPENPGAHARVLRERRKGTALPRMAFLAMDAREYVHSREYIESLDDSNGDRTVGRVLWGLSEPTDNRLRPYVGFATGGYDMATSMFAAHYFFETQTGLSNFARNVATSLRPGGHFLGCCLDGARVAELFDDGKLDSAEGRGPEGGVTWRLTKKYAAFDKADPEKNYGLTVNVFMESIGQTLPEPLVDFRLLVRVFGEHGLRPLNAVEARDLGLSESTGFFDELFEEMARNKADHELPAVRKALEMSDDDKRYSFLNRWFVFKKV